MNKGKLSIGQVKTTILLDWRNDFTHRVTLIGLYDKTLDHVEKGRLVKAESPSATQVIGTKKVKEDECNDSRDRPHVSIYCNAHLR